MGYEEYWGLKEKPFENTADPKFLYMSSQHEEALARLTYTVYENKGISVLTGAFGCGKTVLAEKILDTLVSTSYEMAFIVNPQFKALELLRDIIYNLGYKEDHMQDKDEVVHKLVEILENNFTNGKRSVIIIDEAHLIEDLKIFEELRVLLNYQKDRKFLVTLLLLGQPELREKINNLKQFMQRVAIHCHLAPLARSEVSEYIKHRLAVAGAKKQIFEETSYEYIYDQTGGIPRRINQLCDITLFTAAGEEARIVDTDLIEKVSKSMEA